MKLIFDYDGTLHESASTYIPAFRKTCAYLEGLGYGGTGSGLSDEEVGYWLGFSAREMWQRFAPDLPEDLRERCSSMLGDEMLRLVEAGQGRLYPGIPETLTALSGQGHTLVLCSNCHRRYLATHRDAFELDRWFDAFYCCEDYGWPPKSELFEEIADDLNGPLDSNADYIVVGDRFHDMEIARVHGVKSIGCAYGYGAPEELEGASAIVEDPRMLLAAIERLCG